MKNTNSLIISAVDGTINAFINGKAYTLASGGYYYPMALKAAKARDYEKLIEAIDLDSAVKSKSNGKVTFEDGVLRYNGAKIDNKLSRRVLELVGEGYKLDPFVKFMELCYQNPNPTVIDNLYNFMETTGIMLDEEGWVVGWKKVRKDGYDYYSGTVLYEVGKTVKMDRNQCDENTQNSCSISLHVGSRNYAENLWYKGQGKLLLVRVNPKNVVCVPEYSAWEKLRACEMDVLEEFQVDKEYKPIYFRPKCEDCNLSSPDFDSNDPNFDKDVDLSDENDDEYPNCGCNCDSCGSDNSDDSDNEDENGSENNEDDNIDYAKYDKGWDYMDYLHPDNYKGASNSKPIQLRNDYGQFTKGNTPITKRGPGGRFVKSS